jgi:hypothetical protein
MSRTDRRQLITRTIERLEALRARNDRDNARKRASSLLRGLIGRMGVWGHDEFHLGPVLLDAYRAACTPEADNWPEPAFATDGD